MELVVSDLRISIIIPAYNEERYLGDCLAAVAAQSRQPDEVIVVDNNSTDKTAEIAKSYPFVTLITENKQGVVPARTAGLDAASGDLLVRIDADTRLSEDWLEIVEVMAIHKPDFAGFTGRGTFYDMPFSRWLGQWQVALYQYAQYPAMRGFTLWGAAMAIRHEDWRKIRHACHDVPGIDEDIDMTLLLRSRTLKINYEPELQARMSLRRGQTNPISTIRYVSTWPKNYFINGRYFAAAYIFVLTVVTIVLSGLAWLVTLPFQQD